MNDPDQLTNRIRLAPGVTLHRTALRFQFSRSRGPGGQSVNKVSTRAELRVAMEAFEGLTDAARRRLRQIAGQRLTREDELLLHADSYRSQLRNKQACVDRLREMVLQAATPPAVRKPTRPSRATVRRRLEAKRRRGEQKRNRARWRRDWD